MPTPCLSDILNMDKPALVQLLTDSAIDFPGTSTKSELQLTAITSLLSYNNSGEVKPMLNSSPNSDIEQQLRAVVHNQSLELKMPTPPRFDGSAKTVTNFLNSIDSAIRQHHRYFNANCPDSAKIDYAAAFFTGVPANWFQNLRRSDSPLLSNYPAFVKALISTFGDPTLQPKASHWLLNTELSILTTPEYTIVFNQMIADAGWTDGQATQDAYQRGLSPAVLDILYHMPPHTDLASLITNSLAAHVRLEQKMFILNSQTKSRPDRSHHNSHFSPRPRGSLSAEEKHRREVNHLCMYCASPDHDRDLCSVLQAHKSKTENGSGRG